MKRREFMALIGSAALVWPTGAPAQQRVRPPRVGVSMSGLETDPEQTARWVGLKEGLERLGWSVGHNLHVDVRFAGGAARIQLLARAVSRTRPAGIFLRQT